MLDKPAWERGARRFAVVAAVAVAIAVGAALAATEVHLIVAPAAAALLAGATWWLLTRRVRLRDRIRRTPFPVEWEAVLQSEVAFYRMLADEGRARFRRDLQLFLGETRVTGVGFELDETTRVLAGAGAVMLVFGYPEWEWHQISEVLIYPSRFGRDFEMEAGSRTLGMVGTGAMNRIMILSRPDLLAGFRNPEDRKNVALHEFAHLVDKSDGTIDGVPELGLDRRSLGPWTELVRRKMEEMRRGDSDIDPYGLTNEAEFFAVATEYFFERPDIMRRKHPELFEALERIFRQDLGKRSEALLDAMRMRPGKLRRNAPCPCGSGKKYKKCCLKKAKGGR